MIQPLSFGLAATVMSLLFGLGAGGAVAAERADGGDARPVDARVVRVRVDGTVTLRIRQGATPTLTLTGDPRALSRAASHQSGDTLVIDSDGQGRHSGLHGELVLPALREVVSESFGGIDIAGFSGDDLALTLDGAGSMRVSGSYRRLTVNLGGMGSMQLVDLVSDDIALNLQGAGFVSLAGRTRLLKVDLGGLGSLDAQQCTADTVNVDLSGLGNASVTARQNAVVSLSGLGSIAVYGKPLNRKVSVDGLGKVSWK